ncbi:MAG: 30S ribosome-binding factor RbfA [Actinomycetaceae bacterium]|nr:30S ribosome-binding factor RbfA [Actinomycetaceae bacterium]
MADPTRVRKVADNIRVTVAKLLDTRLKDPRLGFVTVTEVRVTGDLQHATIFYTVLGEEDDRKASAAALESAKGMIRSEVGKHLGIRLTPTIEFILDALPDTAAALEDAIDAAKADDERVAKQAAGAKPAGDANPYREPRHADDDDADAESDQR